MSSTGLVVSFSRIMRQVTCSASLISPIKMKVCLPGGFPYEAFNPRACITPWSMVKMVECARGGSFGTNFLDAMELYKNYFVFNVSTSTIVSPKLYDTATVKGPLVQYVTLNYVGKTSFKIHTAIHIEGNDVPICENDVQSVFINSKTRKPDSPPDWWIQKYSLGANNGVPLKLTHLEPPSGVIVQENYFEVPASDADHYLHVNWSNFIKYFYESYVKSQLKKDKPGDPKLLFRNVKAFSVSFIQEAAIGDSLKIRFWEDKNSKDLFHFHLLKGQELLSESSIELFPIN